MDTTLMIVLIVAAVAVVAVLVMRSRNKSGAAPMSSAPPAQPAPMPEPGASRGGPAMELVTPEVAAEMAPEVVEEDESDDEEPADAILKLQSIKLSGTATNKEEAIAEAGRLLVDSGAVDENYIESMFERERSVSTYMGNLLAIPHGTNDSKEMIASSAVSVVRYPNLVDWNGNPVKYVVGIAGAGGEHIELLARIAEIFLDESTVELIDGAGTVRKVRDAMNSVNRKD